MWKRYKEKLKFSRDLALRILLPGITPIFDQFIRLYALLVRHYVRALLVRCCGVLQDVSDAISLVFFGA